MHPAQSLRRFMCVYIYIYRDAHAPSAWRPSQTARVASVFLFRFFFFLEGGEGGGWVGL